MAILTAEQKSAYLKSDGGCCPFCQDADISGGPVEISGREAWQEVKCQACGETWRDVYKLAFVETDEELDSK